MFQGQERRVIIISTVRSSEQWLNFDLQHNLGFLDNPKRFNVAITRAHALLIVVGNPSTLASDYHWRELLKLCVARGAYRGAPLPDLGDADVTSGGGGGGGGGGSGGGSGGDDDTADEELANELEQLLLDDTDEPSQQVQHEGGEMPSHDW